MENKAVLPDDTVARQNDNLRVDVEGTIFRHLDRFSPENSIGYSGTDCEPLLVRKRFNCSACSLKGKLRAHFSQKMREVGHPTVVLVVWG